MATVEKRILRRFKPFKGRMKEYCFSSTGRAEMEYMQALGVFSALLPHLRESAKDRIQLAGNVLLIPEWFPYVPKI